MRRSRQRQCRARACLPRSSERVRVLDTRASLASQTTVKFADEIQRRRGVEAGVHSRPRILRRCATTDAQGRASFACMRGGSHPAPTSGSRSFEWSVERRRPSAGRTDRQRAADLPPSAPIRRDRGWVGLAPERSPSLPSSSSSSIHSALPRSAEPKACPMNVAIPAASQTCSGSESSSPSLYPSAAACSAPAGNCSTSRA
jgi:hypothetical protein